MSEELIKAQLTEIEGYAVRWNWRDSLDAILPNASLTLANGKRLLIPGVLRSGVNAWGVGDNRQQWRILNGGEKSYRQGLRIRTVAGGPVYVQFWDGVNDVANGAEKLPVIERVYSGTDNSKIYYTDLTHPIALKNSLAADVDLIIEAVFDKPVECIGTNPDLGT